MSKDPAVLFYTSDFLSGVSFMTMEERGQYITLLCLQHQKGSIPFNHMITVCKSKDCIVFDQFKIDSSGKYYNERMKSEADKRRKYCDSRSNNKSGRPKVQIIRKSYDNHMSLHMENENIDANESAIVVKKNDKFEEIWKKYPTKGKIGKKKAEKHFKSSVKTEKEYKNIEECLENYKKSSRVRNGYVQNGSVWFNNWEDWQEQIDPFCEICKNSGKYVSERGYESICNCKIGKSLK